MTLRGRIEERVVDFSAKLPIAERQALAEALRRGPFRQPKPRNGPSEKPAAHAAGDGAPAAGR